MNELIAKATAAMKNAHAPYSNFYVGAAVVGDSGKVYVGCNVENACINAGTCAEPAAIGNAFAGGEKRIKKIVVVNKTEIPCPPCGHCLQIISEVADRDIEIVSAGASGKNVKTYTLAQLMPVTFEGFFNK